MDFTKQAIKGEALGALRAVAAGSGDPAAKLEAAREMWHLAQSLDADEVITVADEPDPVDRRVAVSSGSAGPTDSATVSSGGRSAGTGR